MRKLLFIFVILVLAPVSAFAQMLTESAFRDRLVHALAAATPSIKVTVKGDLKLEIERQGGSRAEVSLDNAYKHYKEDISRLDKVIQTYVAAIAKPPSVQKGAVTLDRTRIIPVIKDQTWLDDNYRGFKARGITQEFVTEKFVGDLVIVYAEDSKERMRYLMSNEDLGIERKELRALAVKNLERILPKIQMANADNLFATVEAGGDYEASLLLFDHIWSSGQVKFEGDIVVAVPAKDTLLVTGSKNRKGLKIVREAAAKFVKESKYPLTETLFVYRDGRFRKFGRD